MNTTPLGTCEQRSVDEHRNRLREDLADLSNSGRPLFITDAGVVKAVVMSPQVFEALCADAAYARRMKAIDESEKQFKEGRYRDALEFLREFAAERGIDLER